MTINRARVAVLWRTCCEADGGRLVLARNVWRGGGAHGFFFYIFDSTLGFYLKTPIKILIEAMSGILNLDETLMRTFYQTSFSFPN